MDDSYSYEIKSINNVYNKILHQELHVNIII